MNARGQGTVELAIASIMFVTLLLLGLWLSEVSFLSVKVQEAASAAVWDATGRQVHDFRLSGAAVRRGYDGALSGPSSVATRITRRYRDFDAARNDGSVTRRLFTRGSAMAVACSAAGGRLSFDVPTQTVDGSATVPAAVNRTLRGYFQPYGGTACGSSADATPWQIPRRFLDREGSGGFFKAELHDGQSIKLCGAGRAVSGRCTAAYGVLLGDWGLDGPPGSEVVLDTPLPQNASQTGRPRNRPYRAMVRALFEESGRRYEAGKDAPSDPGAASRFAIHIGGRLYARPSPTEERAFYMSYSGTEHDYVDMLEPYPRVPAIDSGRCRTCHFNTAGTVTVNGNPRPEWQYDWRNLRRPCFLGLGGCSVR